MLFFCDFVAVLAVLDFWGLEGFESATFVSYGVAITFEVVVILVIYSLAVEK